MKSTQKSRSVLISLVVLAISAGNAEPALAAGPPVVRVQAKRPATAPAGLFRAPPSRFKRIAKRVGAALLGVSVLATPGCTTQQLMNYYYVRAWRAQYVTPEAGEEDFRERR